jgi:hypothetical protein
MKYFTGMSNGIKCFEDILDIDEADNLCRSIDSKYKENRLLRYQRFAKLDLSSERETL